MAQTQLATADGDVLVRAANGVGRITLNRPKAINALTHDMVRTISTVLTACRAKPS